MASVYFHILTLIGPNLNTYQVENETKSNSIDRGSPNPGRGSPMSMDRRLNTGMSRSLSDRHLSNNSPVPDRSLDRASPLLMRSISQSSRLSSRDKRTEFEPALDQLSTTGWSEANSESQVHKAESHQISVQIIGEFGIRV